MARIEMETEGRKVAYGQMLQPTEEGGWKQVPGLGVGTGCPNRMEERVEDLWKAGGWIWDALERAGSLKGLAFH